MRTTGRSTMLPLPVTVLPNPLTAPPGQGCALCLWASEGLWSYSLKGLLLIPVDGAESTSDVGRLSSGLLPPAASPSSQLATKGIFLNYPLNICGGAENPILAQGGPDTVGLPLYGASVPAKEIDLMQSRGSYTWRC